MVKKAPFALTCFKRLNWYEKNNRMLSGNQNYLQRGNIIWHKAYCHSNVNRKNRNILTVWKQGRFKNCSSKRLNWYCETYWQLINKGIKDPRPLSMCRDVAQPGRAQIVIHPLHPFYYKLCLIVIKSNNILIIWEQGIKSEKWIKIK